MKVLKRVFVYLIFIIAIILVACLCCLAYMYFVPGSPILGYEYISYASTKEYTYTYDTDLSVDNTQALEIVTESSDIYIYPNTESQSLYIRQKEGYSGFVKSVDADLTFDASLENKSFEENSTIYKTFCVSLDEPSGLIAKDGAAIYVYVPTELVLSTIFAKTTSGNIYYFSNNTTNILNTTNLYLKTGEFGQININNSQPISNYYLTTNLGSVVFDNSTTLNAQTIKFSTQTGGFNFVNDLTDATLSVDTLFIFSQSESAGPVVKINKLIGNLNIDSENGYFKIDQIGEVSNQKTIALTLANSDIIFGNVYGFVSLLAKNENVSNNVTISNLTTQTSTNIFETGAGNCVVDALNANASFDATSGNIEIKNASITSNVYVYTNSGNINVKYVVSSLDNDETSLSILTKTGNIILDNISCKLDVQVLQDSANSTLNIVFTAVASNDNVIKAKNRNVNLTVKGGGDFLFFRIVSTHIVNISGDTTGSEVSTQRDLDNIENRDFLLDTVPYDVFSYGYRVGYTKSTSVYTSNSFDLYGKLLMTTTGSIAVGSVSTI